MPSLKKYRLKKIRMKKGGCGCVKLIPSMSGGGDYFLPGYTEPPSFDKVPIHSFYPQNMYNVDPQGAQISSRLLPNMTGGKKTMKMRRKITLKRKVLKFKNKRNKKNKNKTMRKQKKMKGGVSEIMLRNTTDPLLNSTNNNILSHGNISGSLLGNNILGGLQTSMSPSIVNLKEVPLA
jgi:hypothetical protein